MATSELQQDWEKHVAKAGDELSLCMTSRNIVSIPKEIIHTSTRKESCPQDEPEVTGAEEPVPVGGSAVETQDLQSAQRKRLKQLYNFATKENERLNRLIEETRADFDEQSEQVQMLILSKTKTEAVLEEVRHQSRQLDSQLRAVEIERDEARECIKRLDRNRMELEEKISNMREETASLESVVRATSQEKARLEAVAEQKDKLERDLAEARRIQSELQDRALQANRVETIVRMGQSDLCKLQRISAETEKPEELSMVLAHIARLESKISEALRHNEELQSQLRHKEKVEQAVQRLETQNKQLVEKARALEVEVQRWEGVFADVSARNRALQTELQAAAHAYTDLEKERSALKVELAEQKVALQEQIAAAKRQVAADQERMGRDIAEASSVWAAKVRQAEEEREAVRKELERTRAGAEVHRAKAAVQELARDLLQQQLEENEGGAPDTDANERDSASEQRFVQDAVHEDVDCADHAYLPDGDAACHALGGYKDAYDEVDVCLDAFMTPRSTYSYPNVPNTDQHDKSESQGLKLRLLELETARAQEADDKLCLTKQLEEAMRKNADLQTMISDELRRKEEATASVGPSTKVSAQPGEPTDFGSMLDGWLASLAEVGLDPAIFSD